MSYNTQIIDIIYRFMMLKGIGAVQTNRFIISIKKGESISEIESSIKKIVSQNQFEDFCSKPSVVSNVTPKYPVNFISLLDLEYPDGLKKCLKSNSPPVLSYIGNLNLLKQNTIAFSGSRNVSEKGIRITKDCVEQLSKKNIPIISGYAKGVDFTAHYTALSSGGSTIMILPEGINNFSIKKELKEVWDWSRVLVISEFIPSEKWMASRAMKRNNTIIGLSDVVIVVEAGETGGSLDAGEKTMQYGKYLFVPKYGLIPDSAIGNTILLSKGAFPIKMNKETERANLLKMFEIFANPDKYFLF